MEIEIDGEYDVRDDQVGFFKCKHPPLSQKHQSWMVVGGTKYPLRRLNGERS